MAYIPSKRDAIFIPSGPSGNHLFVVVTGIHQPVAHGTHLLVNFSSIKQGVPYDTSCPISVGDHPFITVPSYVEYQFARIEMACDLGSKVDNGTFSLHSDPVSDALLAKIKSALPTSAFVARKFKTYLSRYENNA